MKLLYDEEHDILDVFLKDLKQLSSNTGYELHEGIIIYFTSDLLPVQLTLVNFRRLTQLPIVHFDQLANQPEKMRQILLTQIVSTPLSAFLRIDPETNYGHIVSPALLDVCYS